MPPLDVSLSSSATGGRGGRHEVAAAHALRGEWIPVLPLGAWARGALHARTQASALSVCGGGAARGTVVVVALLRLLHLAPLVRGRQDPCAARRWASEKTRPAALFSHRAAAACAGATAGCGAARVGGSGGRGAPFSPLRLTPATKEMGCSTSISDTGGASGVRFSSLTRLAASALWPCERGKEAAAQREGATAQAPARVRLLLEKVIRHRVRQIRPFRRHGVRRRSLRRQRRRRER